MKFFCSKKKQTDEYQKIFGGLTALMNKFASPIVCVSLSWCFRNQFSTWFILIAHIPCEISLEINICTHIIVWLIPKTLCCKSLFVFIFVHRESISMKEKKNEKRWCFILHRLADGVVIKWNDKRSEHTTEITLWLVYLLVHSFAIDMEVNHSTKQADIYDFKWYADTYKEKKTEMRQHSKTITIIV